MLYGSEDIVILASVVLTKYMCVTVIDSQQDISTRARTALFTASYKYIFISTDTPHSAYVISTGKRRKMVTYYVYYHIMSS